MDIETIELPEPEREALEELKASREAHPEGDFFEHDRESVRMPGAARDVNLRIGRETLRRLGHLGVIKFTGARDGFGHGRWTFDLTARAFDY